VQRLRFVLCNLIVQGRSQSAWIRRPLRLRRIGGGANGRLLHVELRIELRCKVRVGLRLLAGQKEHCRWSAELKRGRCD
jgi:hypothetical protein